MGKRDSRVEACIANAGDFAKPILTELRCGAHGMSRHRGEDEVELPALHVQGVLCSMASFKQQAAFGFWKGSLILGHRSRIAEAMGNSAG
jgi:hypothetical protein